VNEKGKKVSRHMCGEEKNFWRLVHRKNGRLGAKHDEEAGEFVSKVEQKAGELVYEEEKTVGRLVHAEEKKAERMVHEEEKKVGGSKFRRNR
jgi:hypothetical protein